jgi:uncharacterized protein YndB with AHSA1/START domain
VTEPNVPLRLDLTFELPGTPEQVWQAIATETGIASWFMPTDLEERVGGAIVLHMGEEDTSTGKVTEYDPPRRFAYIEPDWAELVGHEGAAVTPLATEFLVEAQSGGTCVVRVVSSAFGTGADWELEFFGDMEKGWAPFFANLHLYLTQFPGQRVTSLSALATVPGNGEAVWSAMRGALGIGAVGQTVETHGLSGRVERIGESDALVRVSEPPGFLMIAASDMRNGSSYAQVMGYLFSEGAAEYVAREQASWRAWLQDLPVGAI